jgi:nucleotide-binding universal stress UspA family protein
MKTIIVPIDFSRESLTGLNLAIMIANKTGANILMIHVVEKKKSSDSNLKLEDRLQAELKFEAILRKFNPKKKQNYTLNYQIKEGKIFKEITTISEKKENALIVLSTHGSSGFEELFIGGNAYKIASNSKIPVITVRKCVAASDFKKIILPLDSTTETREKVPYTVKLAKLFHSEIHILTVKHSNSSARVENKLYNLANQVELFIKGQNIPCKVKHLKGSNLTDLIIDYSLSAKANLISIMTEQEKSVSNMLLGNYAHQMISKANIPVLLSPTYKLSPASGNFISIG